MEKMPTNYLELNSTISIPLSKIRHKMSKINLIKHQQCGGNIYVFIQFILCFSFFHFLLLSLAFCFFYFLKVKFPFRCIFLFITQKNNPPTTNKQLRRKMRKKKTFMSATKALRTIFMCKEQQERRLNERKI